MFPHAVLAPAAFPPCDPEIPASRDWYRPDYYKTLADKGGVANNLRFLFPIFDHRGNFLILLSKEGVRAFSHPMPVRMRSDSASLEMIRSRFSSAS